MLSAKEEAFRIPVWTKTPLFTKSLRKPQFECKTSRQPQLLKWQRKDWVGERQWGDFTHLDVVNSEESTRGQCSAKYLHADFAMTCRQTPHQGRKKSQTPKNREWDGICQGLGGRGSGGKLVKEYKLSVEWMPWDTGFLRGLKDNAREALGTK